MKFRLFASSMLALVTAVTLTALPATAHEQLVDQEPKAGQILEAGISEVRLSFSDDLMSLENSAGSEIVILDSNQNPINNGCAVVDGRTATARADIDRPGSYQVGWRVVSGDGHPISGSFSFVVENNTGYIADPEYLFTECANPYNPDALEVEVQTSESLYWLLWASLPLAAVGLFLLLRSKNKSSGNNREGPEKKTEN
jgi:methionine-rich copper-binding protein CopC|tara:strand:+ start:355 stop:951 length:597 start_codon:yes stop_codon:yes gene_type:complete